MDRFLSILREWFVHIAHDPAMPAYSIGLYDRDTGTVEYRDGEGTHVVPAEDILCSHILTADMPYVLLAFENKRTYAIASLVPTMIFPMWTPEARIIVNPQGVRGNGR
ncbi:MAG: hypothetical protein MJ014_00085 [Methanocorpusculum sp.]|nr:hypothetical protein [Methanocorpusculum sp.]